MAAKTKTRKTTVKKVKKPAIEKMLEESVSPREDQINEIEMSIPADSTESLETVALNQEIENLKRENEKLKQKNEELEEEIVKIKENSKKLGELFENYEIEFLKTENESLRSEIEKLKSKSTIITNNSNNEQIQKNDEQVQNLSKSVITYKPGSRLANAREPVLAPTNGYETW